MKARNRLAVTLAAMTTTGAVALFASLPAQAAPGATQAPTRTTLSSTTVNLPFGSDAKVKAVVKPVTGTGQPTGSVTFTVDGGAPTTVPLALVNSVETAKLTISGLSVGDHDVLAKYSGATTYAPSTSLDVTLHVGPAASTTLLTASYKSLVTGQLENLKAVVKPTVAGLGTPAGTVSFFDGATQVGSPVTLALNGTTYQAKLPVPGLAQGDHLFTAVYTPTGGTLAGSTSNVLTVTMGKGSTAVTITAPTLPGDVTIGAKVRPVFPATGIPTGPSDVISFVVDGSAPQLFPVSSTGKAIMSLTLDPGTHTVKVTYVPGSTTPYLTSTSTVTFTV